MTMMTSLTRAACALSLLFSLSLGLAASAHAGLVVNFTGSTGNAQADAGFDRAASYWGQHLKDNMTINVQRGFQALASGVLGQASSAQGTLSYNTFFSLLNADRTSTFDDTAVGSLATGARPIIMNRTADHPNGAGNATPYVAAPNGSVLISTANAKAIGAINPFATGLDAIITFSSSFTWDYNPDDGITAGAFDFVGVAAH